MVHGSSDLNETRKKRLNPCREIWILLYKHKHHSYAAVVLTRVGNLSKKTYIHHKTPVATEHVDVASGSEELSFKFDLILIKFQ